MCEDEISPECRKEYQDAFEMFDKDKDGAITARELGNMMRSISQNPTDEEVNAMIKEVDLNSDGKIELDEFITLMSRNSQILKQRMKSSTHSECLTRKATD